MLLFATFAIPSLISIAFTCICFPFLYYGKLKSLPVFPRPLLYTMAAQGVNLIVQVDAVVTAYILQSAGNSYDSLVSGRVYGFFQILNYLSVGISAYCTVTQFNILLTERESNAFHVIAKVIFKIARLRCSYIDSYTGRPFCNGDVVSYPSYSRVCHLYGFKH